MKTTTQVIGVLLAALSGILASAQAADAEPLQYQIELTAAASGFDGQTCWVHARAAPSRQRGPAIRAALPSW